jgi:hypothetical protein
MITVLIGVMAMSGVGLSVVLYAATKAPMGYEDERVFHYGPEVTEPVREMPSGVPALSR